MILRKNAVLITNVSCCHRTPFYSSYTRPSYCYTPICTRVSAVSESEFILAELPATLFDTDDDDTLSQIH